MNCQRNWLYLESIFSAPDIQRQLPAEAKMFMQVDKSYKDIMRKVNKVPSAIRAGTQPGEFIVPVPLSLMLVLKLLSCSTHLRIKFEVLLNNS